MTKKKKRKIGPLKKGYYYVRYFLRNLYGFFRSYSIVYLSNKNRIYIFYGYGHWWLSKRYADKRHKMDNRRYYVLPFIHEDLLVVSANDRTELTRRGIMRKGITIEKLLKASYYFTKNETT